MGLVLGEWISVLLKEFEVGKNILRSLILLREED